MNTQQRKKQLQEELNAITEQEKKELIEKEYPKVKAKYLGKCFKSRNGFGGNSKRWWLYEKVIEIKPDDLYTIGDGEVTAHITVLRFQVFSNDLIQIDPSTQAYIHGLGDEITETEFNAAWDTMIDKINAL